MLRFLALFLILLGLLQAMIQPLQSFSISTPPRRLLLTATTALSSSASKEGGNSNNASGGCGNNNLVLYGHPGTRSPLVNWAYYELTGDMKSDGLKMGDLSRNPHPFGQIPCLTDNGGDDDDDDDVVVVFESGAILAYLLQNYSPSSLKGSAKASILSWIMWANASLDPICFLEINGKVYDTGLKSDNKRIDRLERILADQGGVLVPMAGGFSLADVAVTSYLLYVVQFFPQVQNLAQKWPNMVQYMLDAALRPAYGLAFGADTQTKVVNNLQAQLQKAKAGGGGGGGRAGRR
jgi:glutathione S-transferase